MDEARALENNPSTDGITGGETSGYYTGSGRSEASQNGKGKSFLKKGGPIGLIIAAVIGLAGASLGGQSFQAFSLVNNIMSNYGSSSYSTTARLTNMINKAISKRTKVKLSSELDEAGDSAGLKFNANADGNLESVTIKSTGETFDSSNIESGMNGKLGDNVAKAGQNVDVQSTYTSETKTKAASRIDWEKNRYSDFDNSERTDTDAEEFKKIAEGDERTTDVTDTSIKEETDEEDGETTRTQTEDGEAKIKSSDDISAKVSSIKERVSNITKAASTIACAYSVAATAVAAIVIAQQISSMINMTSGYMEATQKVQAGDGNGNSLHEYQNATNQTDSSGKGFWASTSIASIFGGDTGDSSAGAANLENVFKTSSDSSLTASLTSVGATLDAWKTCIGLKMASAAVDTIGDIIGIFTAGIGKAVQLAISAAIAIGTSVAAGLIIDAVVDAAVASLIIDPVEDMGTEEAGDYTVSGGNIIMSAMGRSIGQSAGTSEKVAEFNAYKDTVIARLAEYDRDNLSPFDTSSQYTFLGSLKYNLIQFSVLNSSNSVLSFVKSAGTIVSNSVSSLLPTSSAYEYVSLVNQDGDCPLINNATDDGSKALGTALHCNYVSISDTESFDITYEEAVQYLLNNGQLEGDLENHTVVKNSELAKYITFWTVRDSHLGLADSGITNSLLVANADTGNSTADAAINGAIGVVPVAGGAIDFANAIIEGSNYEYIYGAKYVAGSSYWNGDDGGEMMRNIQTFLELDTIYSDLALIETSTLATYLDEYYEENPLDESYEGKLARFSGLSKDQVIAVLDALDYADFIANYDSTNCYKFFETEPEAKLSFDKTSEYVKTVDISLEANRANIVYADPRALYTTSA